MTKSSIRNLLYAMLGFFSTLMLISFGGRPIYYYFALLIVMAYVFAYNKLVFAKDNLIKFYVISLGVSVLLSLISEMNETWKRASFAGYIWFLVIYLFYNYTSRYVTQKNIMTYIKYFKIAAVFQIFWAYMQYFLYQFFSIDVNNYIFNEILGITAVGTFHRDGTIMITGLWPHPQNIAVLAVICWFLFDNMWIKIAFIGIGILSKSSTMMLGLFLCIVTSVFFNIASIKKVWKVNRFFIASVISVGLVCIYVISRTDIVSMMQFEIERLMMRVSLTTTDQSALTHLSYFTQLPDIWSRSGILDILFGFGYRCSGYPFARYYGLYSNLSSFVVECDVVNIILSSGLIGGIVYYSWLLKLALKGKKLSAKYLFCTVIIIILGITYEVQIDWVLIFEMFMFISIKYNYNIFCMQEKA